MKFKLLIFSILFFTAFMVYGQEGVEVDSIQTDSIATIVTDSIKTKVSQKKSKPKKTNGFFRKDYPSPKKAIILSFVFPGAGQAYNKKFWKIPIAVGGVGGMIYLIDFNTKQQKYLNEQYLISLDDDPLTEHDFAPFGWTSADILNARQTAIKNKELSYIGLFAIYSLSAIDAFVDAHLRNFDVSEDLSMQVKPKMNFIPQYGLSMGFGIAFNLKPDKNIEPKEFYIAP